LDSVNDVIGLRTAGLRSQIVVALAVLMLLAFVPLFYAVASLTRATVFAARAQQARALGRSLAAHVSDAWGTRNTFDVERVLRDHAIFDGVSAACAFAASDGRPIACAGASAEGLLAPPRGSLSSARIVHTPSGTALEVVSSSGDVAVVTRMGIEDEADRGAALVRLVALYMITFALALLFFAYIALTRLIVRPIEHLVGAADRVASGARTLHVPRNGAHELVELGQSVRSMTEKLIAEEATLILKVDELTQMQAQLVRSERMASVGRLAAGLAHEIGNPIAALLGMQDLLLDGDLTAEAQRDFVQRMRRETERIHTVVRDLLDFARPEESSDAGGAIAEPADVRSAIDDVTALVRMQTAFRDIRIEVDVGGAPRVVLAAPRLTQVLLNLVLNATAALVSAKRPLGRVTVRARAGTGHVRIEVEDDGPGVAPQVRDRLFEPFVTTKEIGEGTGLGLAVCRGVVESAGGEIALDATYTGGARFYVVLPAAGSASPLGT
jgi:two-component system NtrC family sensor kinase